MGDAGAHYKNKVLVRKLEALLAKLPRTDAPLPQRMARPDIRMHALLDDTQIQAIAKEYQSGSTVYELASKYGISRQKVSQLLKEQGIQMRLRSMTDDEIERAKRLYEDGDSLQRVGDRLGFTARTVHLRLRERGVRMRDTHGRN